VNSEFVKVTQVTAENKIPKYLCTRCWTKKK